MLFFSFSAFFVDVCQIIHLEPFLVMCVFFSEKNIAKVLVLFVGGGGVLSRLVYLLESSSLDNISYIHLCLVMFLLVHLSIVV